MFVDLMADLEFPWIGGRGESRILDQSRGSYESPDLHAGVQG
jgi:hypothetical protein